MAPASMLPHRALSVTTEAHYASLGKDRHHRAHQANTVPIQKGLPRAGFIANKHCAFGHYEVACR